MKLDTPPTRVAKRHKQRTRDPKAPVRKGAAAMNYTVEKMVRVGRLELPRLAAPEPKSGVYTNFTTPAY